MSIRTLVLRIVALVCLMLGVGVSQAHAWVRNDQQPFPGGEAPVVVHRFCPQGTCDRFSSQVWTDAIRDAMAQWNNTGANFTFTERSARASDNPCQLSGAVVIMAFFERRLACAQDRRVFDVINPRWSGVTIYHPNAVHIYLNRPSNLTAIQQDLLHELGHVVGLGHPDSAGQSVEAVMNLASRHTTLQPDDIAGIQALYGKADTTPPPSSTAGFLGSPAHNATVSGIGFVSGWKCDAQDITVRIDGGPPLDMSMGVLREDTRSSCNGEAHNGFITQVNWNSVGAGTHTAVAYDNGIEFDRNTFTVGTTGEEFLRGVVVDIDVPDFPIPGRTSRFVWNQSTQHLELAEVYAQGLLQPGTTGDLSQFAFLIDNGAGDWEIDIDIETATGERYLGFDDVSFLGYRTTAAGRDIMVGHFGVNPGPQTIDFELGHPVAVLPRLPSLHAYRYALVLPLTAATESIQNWQAALGSRASSFCAVALFDTVEKDRYGDINMPVTMTFTARENGVCVPENGRERLSPLTSAHLEIALD